jgi:hypothetical protein
MAVVALQLCERVGKCDQRRNGDWGTEKESRSTATGALIVRNLNLQNWILRWQPSWKVLITPVSWQFASWSDIFSNMRSQKV